MEWLSKVKEHATTLFWHQSLDVKINLAIEGKPRHLRRSIQATTSDLAKLEKAIDTLKPEYKEVIILTKIEGLSYSQIGNRWDKSDDAVRMLLSRAMAALTTAFRNI